MLLIQTSTLPLVGETPPSTSRTLSMFEDEQPGHDEEGEIYTTLKLHALRVLGHFSKQYIEERCIILSLILEKSWLS